MARPGGDVPLDAVAHLMLRLGRLLLQNGAETQRVATAIDALAAAFGCEVHLAIDYQAVIVTVLDGERFRTRISRRLPGMNVALTALIGIEALIADLCAGRVTLAAANAAIDPLEGQGPRYRPWLVALGLGLTAASLARLFGGDWGAFAVSLVAGTLGTRLRLLLGARGVNPFVVPFLTAFASGVIGGGAARFGASAQPVLCLIPVGMILVPGVPLINGVQDVIRNHMTLGIGRLASAGTVLLAIGLGLFAATLLTGAAIPVDETTIAVGLVEDVVFSGLAAIGYALLFGVPPRLAWACVVCGIASHSLRTLLLHQGLDIVSGSLAGALLAAFLARALSRFYGAPAATFVFAGVVAMLPGAYAFRATIGLLAIATHPAGAPFRETASLGAEVLLMTLAIAVGVAVPSLVVPPAAGRAAGLPARG